jgi:hypothetical protein
MSEKSRLTELGESELRRIAEALEVLEQRISDLKAQTADSDPQKRSALFHAKKLYRDRRDREQMFGAPNLFGEPVWDMLLDLFIAAEECKQISVSSLCIASAAPMTTALRWIGIMESQSLIVRQGDPTDLRRIYLELTPNTLEKLRAFFERPSFALSN